MNHFSHLARFTKRSMLGFAVLLGLATTAVRADLPRTPLRTVPRVFGRDIERFVLLAPIVVNRSRPGVPFRATMMIRMMPGTFIPLTEDAGGFFYQAVNGFLRIRGNSRIDGGVYVSKSQQGVIWVYVGSAGMKSKFGVEKDRLPLPASALHSLHVAKPEWRK